MNEVMVSVRMPKGLANELKRLAKSEHFLDVSEEIRSIVRKNWLKNLSPELHELQKLRKEIETEIKEHSARKIQEDVAKELEKIKSQLKKGFNG